MKLLGIDFGTKRMGIAVSDDEASFAFPVKTLEVSNSLFEDIEKIIEERQTQAVVLGDPGNDPGVAETRKKILEFKDTLEKRGLTVFLQSEMMTSLNTDLFGTKKPIANKRGGEQKEKHDESAAALILQRYLDKKSLTKK